MTTSLSLKKCLLAMLDEAFDKHKLSRSSDSFCGHRYDISIPGGRRSISINWHVRNGALVLDPPYVSVRIDEVEDTVAKHEVFNSLATPKDIACRPTIGIRLGGSEIIRILTLRWTVLTEDDCVGVAADYSSKTIHKAYKFWRSVATLDDILAKLSGDPVKVRAYALPDQVGAERAIVLCKLLHGDEKARILARERLNCLSESARKELLVWVKRAFPEAEWG